VKARVRLEELSAGSVTGAIEARPLVSDRDPLAVSHGITTPGVLVCQVDSDVSCPTLRTAVDGAKPSYRSVPLRCVSTKSSVLATWWW
jgi:hypothetical protein